MRENLDAALKLTLKYEGGFVNHPKDPGGATNYGITIATLSHELGRRASVDEVRNMSLSTATNIYRKKYWATIGADALPAGVDALAFDIAVNSGPGRALEWLRQTAGMPPVDRIKWIDQRRRSFYRALKTFSVFGRGWMARENDIYQHALAMTQSHPAEAAYAETPTLRLGASGAAVMRLQRLLNARGFALYADGKFGPKTEDAVKRFQGVNALISDGVVGAKTWARLA